MIAGSIMRTPGPLLAHSRFCMLLFSPCLVVEFNSLMDTLMSKYVKLKTLLKNDESRIGGLLWRSTGGVVILLSLLTNATLVRARRARCRL